MRKRFGFPNLKNLRYSNCWEDTEILLAGLPQGAGKRFLSILSGGDNTFSMLVLDPEVIEGADFCFEQTAVCHLKKTAIKHLSRAEVIRLLGIRHCSDRVMIYRKIRQYLPEDIIGYWDKHTDIIDAGIVYAGKFENYFMVFAKYLAPFLFSKRKIQKLFSEMSDTERKRFYFSVWDSPMYRNIMRMFFSRRLMTMIGRDPAFFKHVDGGVSKHVKKRVDRAMSTIPAAVNPYLHFILYGRYDSVLPFYLQKGNFSRIKKNIDRLNIHHCVIQDMMKENMKYDGYNLSDIFEYMDEETVSEIYKMILASANQGARLVYWNMMVKREAPEESAKQIIRKTELEYKLFSMNKAFFYERLIIEEKK